MLPWVGLPVLKKVHGAKAQLHFSCLMTHGAKPTRACMCTHIICTHTCARMYKPHTLKVWGGEQFHALSGKTMIGVIQFSQQHATFPMSRREGKGKGM